MNWKALLAAACWTSAALAQAPELPGAGKAIQLDLGTKRVNWTNAQWVVIPLGKTVDLSGCSGVKLVVTTDKPRGDAGVYFAVREEDGTWYEHPWAVDLTQAENTGMAKFVDFSTPDFHCPPEGDFNDQDMVLDVSKINAIAFGCVNPFGVGKVSFTVKSVSLAPAEKSAAAAAKVEVSGKLVDINGTTMLPAGLFGGYHLPKGAHAQYRLAMDRPFNTFGGVSKDPITHMYVNCIGDRGTPSPLVGGANWADGWKKMATDAATKAKETGKTYYFELWNEPYLNWSNKNRSMFRWQFFDDSKAVEGGPVHLKGDGSVCPHLKWTRNFDAPPWQWITQRYTADGRDNWRRGKTASGEIVGGHAPTFHGNHPSPISSSHPPKDVKDGEKYTVMVKGKPTELTAFTPWWVYDETQFTFWSATGMGRFLNEPLMLIGKTMKEIYPKTVIISGWDCRPSEDHWANFELAYKPTIDACHEVLDGVTDHDYAGDAIKMPASHELITTYGMTKYNKWLTSWNTETASGADPSVYGETNQAAVDQRKFQWTARKLIHALAFVPDKARSFAWFGAGETNAFSHKGEGVLFTMLMNLRGRLVHLRTDDPLLYGIAAIDGADPQNPRPEALGPGKELVVAVFNDHETQQAVELAVRPPAGTTFSAAAVIQAVFAKSGEVELDGKQDKAASDCYTLKTTLPAKGIVKVTLPLKGDLVDKTTVRVRQYFSPELLAKVTASKPSMHKIAVKEEDLKAAKRAWVRIVVERLAEGEGVVSVNGKDYALPKAVTPENSPWIREVAVDVKDVKTASELTFKVKSDGSAGYLVACASLWLEVE